MSTDLTDEQLAELERLEAAATRGPWVLRRPTGELDVLGPVGLMARVPSGDVADGEFIAAARTAVPLLLRALRDERDENQRLATRLANAHRDRDRWGRRWHDILEDSAADGAKLAAVEQLFNGGPDTSCRTVWQDGIECVSVPLADVRAALTAPTGQEADRG